MARSTEDYLRDAFEFHAEHGARLATPEPAPLRPPLPHEGAALRPGRSATRRWIPAAAFGAVAAIAAVVATVTVATSGGEDESPATAPDSASVASVASARSTAVGPVAVAIPDLVGLTLEEAKTRLASIGLTMMPQETESNDQNKGRALAQNPTPDTLVNPGSTVTITFGAGVGRLDVPDDLVGRSLLDARNALATAGFTVVDRAVDSTEPRGVVVDVITQGAQATVRWSNNSKFVMPDLTGLTPKAAADALLSLGWAGDLKTLTAGAKSAKTADPAQVGKILTQTPPAGGTVAKTVRIGVGIGTE